MSDLREATDDEVREAFGDSEDGCCGCSWKGLVAEMRRYLDDAGLAIVVTNADSE